MKVVVQRALNAACIVNDEVVGKIEKGFVLLVGFEKEDTKEKLDWMVNKITNLRVFEDEEGKMNLSLKDIGGEILSISQFTLYGDVKKGFRPSFTKSLNPEDATVLFNDLNNRLNKIVRTETGVFGAEMKISFTNDGPVTIIIEK